MIDEPTIFDEKGTNDEGFLSTGETQAMCESLTGGVILYEVIRKSCGWHYDGGLLGDGRPSILLFTWRCV